MKLLLCYTLILHVLSIGDEFFEVRTPDGAEVLDARALFTLNVEYVEFGACEFQLTEDEFYGGILAGFHLATAWTGNTKPKPLKIRENEMRVLRNGRVVSNYNGPPKGIASLSKAWWYDWQYLSFDGDLRKEGLNITLEMLGGMPHTFIPLLHPKQVYVQKNVAYMLHIVPNESILPYNPTTAQWKSDVFWFDKVDITMRDLKVHAKYIMNIDLEKVIKSLDSQRPSKPLKYFTGYGLHDQLGYTYETTSNYRHKPMMKEKSGNPGEYLCASQASQRYFSFMLFKNELNRYIPWAKL